MFLNLMFDPTLRYIFSQCNTDQLHGIYTSDNWLKKEK